MSERYPLLTCEDIGFKSARGLLFQNFNASFMNGGFIAIYGSSGMGTSTLLKILANIIKPHQGKVLRDKKAIFIDHKLAIEEDRTVLQNLNFWAKIAGEFQDIVDIACHHFGLETVMREKCSDLSYGEKKRVSLAKLMILRSDIWVLDRPFEQIDDEGAFRLLSAIAGRTNNNGLVICSTGIERSTDYFERAQKICIDHHCA